MSAAESAFGGSNGGREFGSNDWANAGWRRRACGVGRWTAVATILGWIPRPIRDVGYRLVARFRYRLFGRLDTCPIPTASEQNRFL